MRFQSILRFLLFAGLCVCLTSGELWLRQGIAAQKSRIVFTSTRDGNAEIYVMDPDGGNPKRLTENLAADWQPSWSPDGQKIAFVSNRDGGRVQIYVMDGDGGNPVKLTDGLISLSPSWAPNGQEIVFASSINGESMQVYVMDSNGNNRQRLTAPQADGYEPAYSPDGQKIVFISGRDGTGEIYMMDSDGGNQTRLTDDDDINEREPAWSPDGEKIAFTASVAGSIEICVIDADGRNRKRLTDDLVNDYRPAWSPDGRFIAYASSKHVDAVLGQRIHLMTANGKHVARLGGQHGGDDDDPDWYNPAAWTVSPAGNQIIIWGRLKKLAPHLR